MLRPRITKNEASAGDSVRTMSCQTFAVGRDVVLGRSVLEHCQIVGEVAKALIARQPDYLRERLYPRNAHLVAAAHDIGKVSPTFYEKLRQACCPVPEGMPALEQINPQLETSWVGMPG